MITTPYKILMLEDDQNCFLLVQEMLSCARADEFSLQWCDRLDKAREHLSREPVDLVLLDLHLSDSQGLATFAVLHELVPRVPIVILSGADVVPLAVEAVKLGAEDYLVKGALTGDLLVRVLNYAVIRSKVREDLRAREERYSQVIEQTGHAICDGDIKAGTVMWLGAIEQIAGYTREELSPSGLAGWWEKIYPEDRAEVMRLHREGGVSKHPQYYIEYRVRNKQGAVVYIEETGIFQYEQGKSVRFLATLKDITGRKNFENELMQHNEFLSQVIESLTYPFYVLDASTGKVLLANSAGRELMFWEGVQCCAAPHVPGEMVFDKHVAPLEEIKKEKKALIREHVHLNREGQKRFREVHDYPILDRGGEVLYLVEYGLDITERRLVEQRLQEERDRAQRYLDTAGVMMVVVDPTQRVTLINKKGCEVLGYPEQEIVGRDWFDLTISSEEREKLRQYFVSLMNGVVFSDAHENKVVTKSGQIKIIAWKNVLLRAENGEILGTLSSGEDITERKKMQDDLVRANYQLSEQEKKLRILLEIHSAANEDLREAQKQLIKRQQELIEQKSREEKLRKDAEAATRAKGQFLANMSHEVRTPLNSIIGFMNLLRKTSLTDKQSKYAENVYVSGKYLLAIINDILEFEKVLSGKITMEETEFDFSQLVGELVGVLRQEHEKKPVALEYDLSADIPTVLWGDPERLRQILHNLLNNAFKFTTQGRIHIAATRADEPEDDFTFPLKVIVSDTGIGIPGEKKFAIFDAFTQADDSVTRKYGGTGLGLTICAAYVKMMMGRIWVESELGKGSRFVFVVNLKKKPTSGSARHLLQSGSSLAAAPFKGIRILVAEDHEETRKDIYKMAVFLGLDVDFAYDGNYAVEKIKSSAYDLCLMDIKMPCLGGIEATSLIRRDVSREIPIIALTEADFLKNREACLSAGMNDFLAKPVSLEQLKARIQEHVLNKRSGEGPLF